MSQADDDYEVKQVPLMQDEEQSESTIDASSEIEVPLT